jgi:hypothetical protein
MWHQLQKREALVKTRLFKRDSVMRFCMPGFVKVDPLCPLVHTVN